MEICKDTPKILIDVLYNVDIEQIDKKKMEVWLNNAYKYIDFFVPKRTEPFETIKIDLPDLPNEIGYLLNIYDFRRVNPIYVEIAKNWIKANLPMIENKKGKKK